MVRQPVQLVTSPAPTLRHILCSVEMPRTGRHTSTHNANSSSPSLSRRLLRHPDHCVLCPADRQVDSDVRCAKALAVRSLRYSGTDLLSAHRIGEFKPARTVHARGLSLRVATRDLQSMRRLYGLPPATHSLNCRLRACWSNARNQTTPLGAARPVPLPRGTATRSRLPRPYPTTIVARC